MSDPMTALSHSRAHLVSQYFTPLAVLLVANGVILTSPPSPGKEIVWAVLVFSAAFNYLSARWIDRDPDTSAWKLSLRLWLNIVLNVLFVYILLPLWPPIWLLLVLSPIASAIYGSRNKTVATAFAAAAVLLIVQHLRGEATLSAWAEQITYALFIVLISLAVYKLVQAPSDEPS